MDNENYSQLLDFWSQRPSLKNPEPIAAPSPLTARWIKEQAHLPWLRLHLDQSIDWSKVLDEAKKLDSLFVPHRAKGGHSGWSSLVIYGLGLKNTENYSRYGFSEEPLDQYDWTEISNQIPYTIEVFKNLFPHESYKRIRFMKLSAGGYILPHYDSLDRYLGPVNIALNQPENCHMLMDGYGEIPFTTGSVFNVDVSLMHSVWNLSNEDRYHIIVHGSYCKDWDPILEKSFLKENKQPTKTKNSFSKGPSDLNKTTSLSRHTRNIKNNICYISLTDTGLESSLEKELIDLFLDPSVRPIQIKKVASKDLHKHLNDYSKEFDGAIILHPGIYIDDIYDFNLEAQKLLNNMNEQNVPLSGHIMDWGKGKLPYLHEQLCLVNFKFWDLIKDSPLSDNKDITDFPSYLASPEKFHDHYTPYNIKNDQKDGLISGKSQWGTQTIAKILKNKLTVHNIPQSLREQKIYSYPFDSEDDDGEQRINNKISNRLERWKTPLCFQNNISLPKDILAQVIISFASGFQHLEALQTSSAKNALLFANSPRELKFWKSFHTMKDVDEAHDFFGDFCSSSFEVYLLHKQLKKLITRNFDGKASSLIELMKTINFEYISADFLTEFSAIKSISLKYDSSFFLLQNYCIQEPVLFKYSQETISSSLLSIKNDLHKGSFFAEHLR